MAGPGRRGAIAFFVIFGVSLVALAAALNVGWIVMTWSEVGTLLLGVLLFAAIITGLILNTLFLVREIRRNDQQNAFVNAVTHELKTPITSIRLHLQTLVARGAALTPETRDQFYGLMLEDTNRLLETVDQVLHTGQAGRTPLHLERQDLAALAQECVAFTRSRLHLPDAALTLAPPADAVEVLGDRNELRGAIVNLLDNAVKFSGEHIEVDVQVLRHGDRALLKVRDRGPGLPPAEAKRIFKRFYRVPGPLTQRVKGTGLGLFIVQSAAKRHGGRAYAESAGPGTGSTFYIELPAAPATAA
ncbi:MAG TPA: HAMP domain-containing sensor histidine kinase [Vicinamibacterales bacterium]|nr:HAMP domain-containing sensor histidine kinase [Vicinamibacterales bacterium]